MSQMDNYSFNIEVNSLVSKEKAPKAVRENIPEWALFFKAVASNWNLNRNGYIIRAKAWITNALGKRDTSWLDAYLENWKILFQHDSNKPIGKPLSLKVVGNELILTGWVLDNTHSNWDIGRGLVTSISTGHITHNREFENTETGEVQNEEEFFGDKEQSPWDKLWSGLWVVAVTSAEIVENSFVTIPSNRDSHIINNSKYLINKLWVSEDKFNTLLSKNKSMNKKDLEEMKDINLPAGLNVNDAEDVEAEEVATEEEVSTEETTTEEVTTDEETNSEEETNDSDEEVNSEETETPKGENSFKKEENKNSDDLEARFGKLLKNAISDLKNDLTKEFDLKMNKLREDKREDLKDIVKDNSVKSDENPEADFKNALRK